MITLSIKEQRLLCQQFKEARFSEANHLIAIYKTGNYSTPTDAEIMERAKNDILNFINVFESKVVEEISKDLV